MATARARRTATVLPKIILKAGDFMFALMLDRYEVQKLRLSRPAEAGLIQYENSGSRR